MADEPADNIEMVVESVRVHMLSSRHVVILKDAAQERYLPIWIGPWEASAIAMRLQGLTPERPLTHDLFAGVLGELGVRLDRVLITSLADETFHARLVLVQPDARHEIDARPSDAIALAVRMGVPIYAAAAVLDQASLGADSAQDADDEGRRSAWGGTCGSRARGHGREDRSHQAGHLPRVRELARRRGRPAWGRRPVQLTRNRGLVRPPRGVAVASGGSAGQSPRIGRPRRSARSRFAHSRSRRPQKSLTARQITDGRAPVGEPAVRG